MKIWVVLALLSGSLVSHGAAKSPFDDCVDSLHKSGGLSIRQAQELCLKAPSDEVLSCQQSRFLRSFVEPLSAYQQCVAQPFSSVIKTPGYQGQFEEKFLDPKKKTVCSVTVNSEDERELFKRHYSARDYNFIELLPAREPDRFVVRDSRWLQKACQAQVKCDVMVLSGHFAESFLGESGFEISAQDLHAAACTETCQNFFSSIKEVYLFGCNTLASKKPDARSVQQYVKILTEDGLGPHKAQRVAARRYTQYSIDYFTEMRALFVNAENIFGYPSVGPSGRSVAKPLGAYLQGLNQAPGSFSEVFKSTLGRTGMVKTSGLKNNLCDTKDSVLQSLRTFGDIRSFVKANSGLLPVPVADVLEESFSRGVISPEQQAELKRVALEIFKMIPAREQKIRLCPLLLAQHKSYLPSDVRCQESVEWLRGL